MSPCIESSWPSRTADGYARRAQALAHRAAWEDEHGPIPPGQCVLHRCDNPPCVNPDHLFLGTKGDNNRDRSAKGRTYNGDQRGERNNNARLTDADRAAIVSDPRGHRAVARAYGISDTRVRQIRRAA